MSNFPSRPGPTPPPNNVPGDSRLAKAWKVIARPLFVFGLLAILVALGALFSRLESQSAQKEAAAATTATPAKATATSKASSTPTARPTATPDGVIKIFITGEVVRPGVYQMRDGDRIIDAVQTAGGFSEAADRDRVDQAQRVRDEMRIEIPRKQPTVAAAGTAGAATASIPEANPAVAVTAPVAATVADSRVNINTASVADLEKLPGIGEVLAQRIADYRLKNGSYRSVDDLRKVTGVTNSVIEKIKDLIVY